METTRAIPRDLDPAVVDEIDARLAAVERDHDVRLGFAIESGSRAWGFPSPDSDYDCRFVYVRSRRDYLSLFPKRDVIETPMTSVLDVNGWDVAKAIKLLLRGNAVIVEWLMSPIVYTAEPDFRSKFLELAREGGNREQFAHHYVRLAQRTSSTYLDDKDDVSLKKIFYALRPTLALRWLEAHPGKSIAPMNIHDLMKDVRLPDALTDCVGALLVEKAKTRELGRGPMPKAVADFIAGQIERADTTFTITSAISEAQRERADAFFHEVVERYAPA